MNPRHTLLEALALLLLGALLSWAALRVRGQLAVSDLRPLEAALDAQVPVFSWGAREVAARLRPSLLVVDARSPEEHEAGRPAGSLNLPFRQRLGELFQIPEGRQVEAVLVVAAEENASEARELARWLAREWAVVEIATLSGGWSAWRAAGLPVTP